MTLTCTRFLSATKIGYRRAGTRPHTEDPEKTAVLQDGQVLNFDF